MRGSANPETAGGGGVHRTKYSSFIWLNRPGDVLKTGLEVNFLLNSFWTSEPAARSTALHRAFDVEQITRRSA
jgi:hypothetical protein